MTQTDDTMIIRSQDPYNAETPLRRLRAHIVTGASDFYVRSHGNVPEVDPNSFRLAVTGLVGRPLQLSLDNLKERFAEHTIEAVMQCAGNRRADLNEVKSVAGDPWEPGAIGNAVWTGVRLVDLLEAAEVDRSAGKHVAFLSLDECTIEGKTFNYGASIPIAKALSPEVLLAYAMNKKPLEPKHGFPLRVVVPGYAGVRSPKWVHAIEVCGHPSDNPIQAEDYKLLPPDIERTEDIDWRRGVTINEMPLNSAICEPAANAEVAAGKLRMRGYAMASEREITRVDVSSDGGQSWEQAALEGAVKPWSWTFWTADIAVEPGERELVVRAWDAAGQTQPAEPSETWNVKGYLSSAWHRVAVTVV